LVDAFGTLAPWPPDGDLSPEQWDQYIAAGATVQRADPDDVERSLTDFLGQREGIEGAAAETSLFLLMRVVFDLPEKAPASERRSFKGWINWPPAAPDGTVSLAWPLSWDSGRPTLVAPYEGSEGPRSAAAEEYRYLLERYPFRGLPAEALR
jgi:hypothetical protein